MSTTNAPAAVAATTTPAAAAPSHSRTTVEPAGNVPLAIGIILIATLGFTGLDSTAKYLVVAEHLPVFEVVWIRFMSQVLAILMVFGMIRLPDLMRTRRPLVQAARSLCMLASTFGNLMALKTLRLDQTASIVFLAPLAVALLAGPLLGEWIGWRRMIAVCAGFLGVLIVVRPGFGGFQTGMLWSLFGMLGYAGFILLTRQIAGVDPLMNKLFISMIAGCVLMAPPGLADWTWPHDGWGMFGLVMIGIYAAIAHYLFILAHKFAPAPLIAPFTYFQLLGNIAVGYAVFADIPDLWTLVGGAVIIGSGLYLLHRERTRARERTAVLARDHH